MLRIETRNRIQRAAVIACAVVIAGCAVSNPSAPIEDRSPTAAKVSPPPVTMPPSVANDAQARTYSVKKGDTLYSIALQFGLDYRQLATWNGIDNSYLIHVDQVLKLGPAEEQGAPAIAQAAPVAGASVEQRQIGAGAPPVAVAAGDVPTKATPSGQKQPYSDAALAELSKPETAAAPVEAAKPPAPAEHAADDDNIGWIWPAAGSVIGQFSEGKNKGVDIGGKSGEPVLSAGNGVVLYVGNGVRGYGNLVVVKHTANFISVYAHNSKILVTEQQAVKKGQKIAEMGDSDADQVKLHFEIRRQGKPVDPLGYLPNR